MMVSTKGRYALRVMLDLAQQDRGKFVPLRDIATRQGISEKYLETILPVLIKNEFLIGLRGKGGGYKLTRNPCDYTVANIIKLVENSYAPVSCLETGEVNCDRANSCQTLPVWQGLYKVIDDYLDGITLEELCKKDG